MSHPDTVSTTSTHTECPRVADQSSEDVGDDSLRNTKPASSDGVDGERSEKKRVLKEVGLTSSTFIGPIFPPRAEVVKSDIEDSLSEFYKELEQIDATDGANVDSGTQDRAQPTSTSLPTRDVSQEKFINARSSAKIDSCWKSSDGRQSSWPHWYQNGPYYPRRPRPGFENQRHYPQPLNRPPTPRLHQTPFHHHHGHPPPPPPAFTHPQNQPPHVKPNWSDYQDHSHFLRPPGFPPPHVPRPHTHGEDFPNDVDRREWGHSYDHGNVGRSQFDEDYYGCETFYSGNELWEQQHHCRPPDITHSSSLVLILMRGLPGSGKSTLARQLLSSGPSGLILSTDDYFAHNNGYRYDAGLLGAAHEWNQSRAKDAMNDGRSPVIIDNTNLQAWEMKPYVQMALEKGYSVDFCEPDTSWKLDPYELEKRNTHGVSHDKIGLMLDRFSFPVSVDIVMRSQEPLHVTQRHRPEQMMMMMNRPLH